MKSLLYIFLLASSLSFVGCDDKASDSNAKVLMDNSTQAPKSVVVNKVHTLKDSVKLELEGEAGSVILLNGEIIAEIGDDGKAIVKHKLSGEDGNKTISIVLENPYGKRSKPITVSVVKDTTPPNIELVGSKSIDIEVDSNFIDPGIKVSDNISSLSDINITKNSNLDINTIGKYSIEYIAKDKAGNSSSVTRELIVIPKKETNHAPTYNNSLKDINTQDAKSLNIDLSQAFSDPDGDTLTYTVKNLPSGLKLEADKIRGTLANDASIKSPYDIEVTAKDPAGKSVQAKFKLNITNPAPLAKDDSVSLNQDTNIEINVLSNDSDIDGDTITIKAISKNPTHATAVIKSNKILYTPEANYKGSDSFKYLIEDAQGATSEAEVTVSVKAVNHAPTYNNTLKDINTQDAKNLNIDLSQAFSDPDGDTLSYTVNNLPSGLKLEADKITGTLANDASIKSPYNIEVTAKDPAGKSVVAKFKLEVEASNITANNDNLKTIKNRGIAFYPYKNDSAKNGLNITTIVVEQKPQKGNAIVDFNGTIIYKPNNNEVGEDRFTYKICDKSDPENCDNADVIITIEDMNTNKVQKQEWGFKPFDIPDNIINVTPSNNIQYEIDKLKRLGGGIIKFGEGTYYVRNLKIPHDIVLEGAGIDKTILKVYNGGNLMEARGEDASDRDVNSGSRNIIVRNLTADCRNNNDNGCLEFNYGTYNVLVENIHVFGASRSNIGAWNEKWSKAGYFTIRNVISHDTEQWHGIALRFIKGAIVKDNIIYKVNGDGIDLSRVDHGEMVNNYIYDTGYGSKFPGCNYMYIHDNYIEGVWIEGGIKFNPMNSTYNNEYFHLENNVLVHTKGGIIDWGDTAPSPHFAEFVSKNNIVKDDDWDKNLVRVANGTALYDYGDNVKDRYGEDPSDNFDIYKVRTKDQDPYDVDGVGYKSWPKLSN